MRPAGRRLPGTELKEYRPTSSEVALKSEVTAHRCIGVYVHRYETVSVDDAKPSTLSPSEIKTDPKLKTWCAGGGGGATVRVPVASFFPGYA